MIYELLGKARLSMIAESPSGERYQGIVALEKGAIEVNCEFCHAHYVFDKVDVAGLFNRASNGDETVRH